MERSDILATMGELKLYGMKAAFDEIIATAVKRQHEPQRIVGDLLTAEISEKQARSIKSAVDFKTPVRAQIEKDGYTIIVNIGDQPSDLLGGHAEKCFLLPDPFYRV